MTMMLMMMMNVGLCHIPWIIRNHRYVVPVETPVDCRQSYQWRQL